MSVDCDMSVGNGVRRNCYPEISKGELHFLVLGSLTFRSSEMNHWAESFHAHGPLSPVAAIAGASILKHTILVHVVFQLFDCSL